MLMYPGKLRNLNVVSMLYNYMCIFLIQDMSKCDTCLHKHHVYFRVLRTRKATKAWYATCMSDPKTNNGAAGEGSIISVSFQEVDRTDLPSSVAIRCVWWWWSLWSKGGWRCPRNLRQ